MVRLYIEMTSYSTIMYLYAFNFDYVFPSRNDVILFLDSAHAQHGHRLHLLLVCHELYSIMMCTGLDLSIIYYYR